MFHMSIFCYILVCSTVLFTAEKTLLSQAALDLDFIEVNRLIVAGADVNEKDVFGMTALDHVVQQIEAETLQQLRPWENSCISQRDIYANIVLREKEFQQRWYDHQEMLMELCKYGAVSEKRKKDFFWQPTIFEVKQPFDSVDTYKRACENVWQFCHKKAQLSKFNGEKIVVFFLPSLLLSILVPLIFGLRGVMHIFESVLIVICLHSAMNVISNNSEEIIYV